MSTCPPHLRPRPPTVWRMRVVGRTRSREPLAPHIGDPRGQLAIADPRGVKLTLPHPEHRDPVEVAQLERGIGRDVDAPHVERPVEADPPQRAMRLLAQVAAGPLVQRHRERLAAVGAQPREDERAPEIPAEHG